MQKELSNKNISFQVKQVRQNIVFISIRDAKKEFIKKKQTKFVFEKTTIIVNYQPARYDIWYDNVLISKGIRLCYENQKIVDHRILDHLCYGLGEVITERFERNNAVFEGWNKEKSSYHNSLYRNYYSSFPCMLFKSKITPYWFGYYLNDYGKTYIDIGHTKENQLLIKSSSNCMNVYVYTGDSLVDVHKRMIRHLGLPFLPKLWMIGYHHSRYGYKNSVDIENAVENCKHNNIPVESIWYDIDTMQDYKNFTLSSLGFPHLTEHLNFMKKEGIKKVLYINPAIKTDDKYIIYRNGIKENIFLLNENHTPYIGSLWCGASVFPDFTSKNIYSWLKLSISLIDNLKYDGLCLDMNEPTDFSGDDKTIPENVILTDGKTHFSKIHNLYANMQAKAIFEISKKMNNGGKFLISRSGFIGIQKYAALWTGDNYSTWDNLRNSISQIINAGISGIGFIGADVGGFRGNVDEELLVRWYQLGAFYPFFRNHSEKNSRNTAPWFVQKSMQQYCINAIRMRYYLLPYLYQQFIVMSKTGIPVFRPLFYDFDKDIETYKIYDQFLWGDAFMVAPVLAPEIKKRIIYFPDGEWIDFYTGKYYQGLKFYCVDLSIEYIPTFVKKRAIIQIATIGKNSDCIPSDEIQLLAFNDKEITLTTIYDRSCSEVKLIHVLITHSILTMSFTKSSKVKKIIIRIQNKYGDYSIIHTLFRRRKETKIKCIIK